MEGQESQRMEELKKVYADVILNTMREAAARVMLSEGKARRFEQEAQATKDDALRMLTRLKQMLDSKTTAAEVMLLSQRRTIQEFEAQLDDAKVTSFGQKRRIQELEAQLDAEVTSLSQRRRIQELEAQLDDAKVTSLSQKRRIEELEAQFDEAEQRIVELRIELKQAQDETENIRNNHMQSSNTQTTREDETLRATHESKLDTPEVQSMDTLTKLSVSELRKLPNGRSVRRPIKDIHRRKVRHGNATKGSRKSRPNNLKTPSVPLHCRTLGDMTGDNSNDLKDQAVRIIPKGFRKRMMRCRKTTATSFSSPGQFTESHMLSSLSSCRACSINDDVNSGAAIESTRNEDIDGKLPGLNSTFNGSLDTQNATDIDEELIDVSIKEDIISLENLSLLCSKMNCEMIDASVTNNNQEDAKANEANIRVPSQRDTDKPLKYAFHRKRKKEALSNLNENAYEKNSMKRREVEKQNCAPSLQNSSLIGESCRDSRRLFQVARQLISLSGKRWW